MKVDPKVVEWLKGIRSEIVAGSVLIPKSDEDRAWNNANQRSARIVDLYIRGDGMFQIETEGSRS